MTLLFVLWAGFGSAWAVEKFVDREGVKRKVRRNPFSLPRGIYYKSKGSGRKPRVLEPVAKKVEEKKEIPEPPPPPISLQAIVIGEKGRVATINNKNFLVGDRVLGQLVISIDDERVLLLDKTQTKVLQLNRPKIPVRVSGPP